MLTRLTLPLAAIAGLVLSSCMAPPGSVCHTYSLGPAYNGEGYLYPRPSYVADHSYPSMFEPVHMHCAPPQMLGAAGYGTDRSAQIPYFYR